MQKTSRIFMIIGGSLGALGIILGAFGAHSIKGAIPDNLYQAFLTGARHHMIHAIFLIVLAFLMDRWPQAKLLVYSGIAIAVGILLFSGSLYLLALTPLKVGLVTPLGGIILIAGWLLLVINFVKKQST